MSANSARASTASWERRAARNARPRLAATASAAAPVEMLLFDGASASHELVAAILQADALLISAAPAEGRDPVLATLDDEIARAPRLRSVVYLSSLGVYGDSGGPGSTSARKSSRRSPAAAARASRRNWLGRRSGRDGILPVAILRLGGIYGPGQNGMVRLLRGTVHRIAKPGHVSNRIHVYDIAQAIEAAFARRADGRVQRRGRRAGTAERSDRVRGALARNRSAAGNSLCAGQQVGARLSR